MAKPGREDEQCPIPFDEALKRMLKAPHKKQERGKGKKKGEETEKQDKGGK